MEREIKFRAWDKKNKKMLSGFNAFDVGSDGQIWMNQVNVSAQFILMQYTGLKDKSGVEIFEGDIVKSTYSGLDKTVIEMHSFCYYLHDYALQSDDSEYYTFNGIEVIGNIHENPELLEK